MRRKQRRRNRGGSSGNHHNNRPQEDQNTQSNKVKLEGGYYKLASGRSDVISSWSRMTPDEKRELITLDEDTVMEYLKKFSPDASSITPPTKVTWFRNQFDRNSTFLGSRLVCPGIGPARFGIDWRSHANWRAVFRDDSDHLCIGSTSVFSWRQEGITSQSYMCSRLLSLDIFVAVHESKRWVRPAATRYCNHIF